MLALRKMALRGHPINRRDRLARQTMAYRLSLTPWLYNFLVFGGAKTLLPQRAARLRTTSTGTSPIALRKFVSCRKYIF